MSRTYGWTMWDPSSVTTWEHLPSGMRCHLVLQDAEGHQIVPTEWQPLQDYLPSDEGDSLARMTLAAGDATVEVECGARGDVTACRVRMDGGGLSAHWEVEGAQEGWQVRTEACDVAVAPPGAALPEDVSTFLDTQRDTVRLETPQGTGLLGEPLQAMEAAIAANTFILPETGEVATLSRHMAAENGAWTIHNWQGFLTTLGIVYTDPDLALANFSTMLTRLSAGELLGATASATGVQADISNPPVAAYVAWKLYQFTGSTDLLELAYPLLLRWHDWWLGARDGNYNRLLGWANPQETGMPEHPLYRNVPIDEKTGVMRLDDIGLCSLWSLDAFALMRMALALKDLDQATRLEVEMANLAEHANLVLWDNNLGTYRSRRWDGIPTERESATALLALVGRIPTAGRAERIVQQHLNAEFNVPYLVPTLGADDADFRVQQPWVGRVSPMVNALICEGLRQFGIDEWAERITLSGLDLLQRSWQDDKAVYASYNALTGAGNDIPQDPLAPTGVLLGALGIAMLIDMEPWGGMRLGNTCGADISVEGVRIGGHTYDISSGPEGLNILRDDQSWIETDCPAILRKVITTDREFSASVKLAAPGRLRLRAYGFRPQGSVTVRINGQATKVNSDDAGMVEHVMEIVTPKSETGPWGE